MKDKIQKVIDNYNLSKQEYLNSINNEKTFKEKMKKRIPNLLTKSRILAPFLIAPAAILGNFTIAAIIAGLFGLTDAFDGHLARKWNATSEYGRLLDTISDKMFALGLILPFLFTNPLIILPSMLLEIVIGSVNVKSKVKQNNPHSTLLGKIKTNFLYISLTLLYLFKCLNLSITNLIPLIGITNIFQGATALQYHIIDKKQDQNKIKKEETTVKEEKQEVKTEELSQTQKDIIAYKNIKESLLSKEEEAKRLNLTKKH